MIMILAIMGERCGVPDQPLQVEKQARSPVLADGERTWMAVSKDVRWFTGRAVTVKGGRSVQFSHIGKRTQ
jgi:hypothetical protein